MRKLAPSRLVVVRSYRHAAGLGGTSVVGADDRRLLLDAGIEAYVKSGGWLMVPGSRAADARELLEASPNLLTDDITPACPRCRAPHPAARRPYGLGIIVLGLVIGATSMVAGYQAAAFVAVAAGVIGAAILEMKLAPWRCVSCGYHYGRPQDDPNKVVRMPRRS